jgi:hypothetical protein
MTGDTMDIAFNNLAKIVHHFGSSKLKNDLFHYCLEEFPKEKYSNFGWHEKFFELFPILISCAEHEQKYLALLDHQIEKEEQREHGFGYGLETVLMKKLAFLKQKGKTKETQKLLEKYLHLFRIREMVVNEAIEEHNYDRAKALIEEGIEISQRSRYPGLVMNWKDKLLTIAKLEDNIADVRTYAED